MLGLSAPRRSARMRIWGNDSSPDAYRTEQPDSAKRWATCSNSVDFPIPGSPPISVTDPSTRPPPNTRSNSPMPVEQRARSETRRTSVKRTGGTDKGGSAAVPVDGPPASSTRLFHVPHSAQRPSHFGLCPPHDWQTKIVRAFGMKRSYDPNREKSNEPDWNPGPLERSG